jgi:putative YpdA family bacillithiol system oxidoreductase
MDTLLSFFLAAAVTFYFVRGYLKKLAVAHAPAGRAAGPAPAAGAAEKSQPCPRCSERIVAGASFCPRCGAPLALWKIHSAAVTAPAAEATRQKVQPVINASLCVGCGSCVHACPETGTLELVGGKAILAHPERCTAHAKCAEACPTQAIALASGGVLQTLRVPQIGANFETNLSGLFIVGELGGMGLIKSAINEGRLVMDHLKERLGAASVRAAGGSELYDVSIVGAGPAGLSASLTAQQYGLRYVTFEQGEIASTIRQYPRQKFLMAEPIEMPLYGSLYIADGTKEALLSVWETIIANTGVRVNTNEGVQSVRRNDAGFYVETVRGRYHARFVVLAMGRRGRPRKLGVPGEELSKVAYRVIEAEEYAEKDILVVGGGDSALEAALALSRSGRNRVTLSYRGDNFVRAKERNRQQLAAACAEKRLDLVLNSHVVEIQPDRVILEAGSERCELRNDFVFILIGGESPEEFLQKCGVEMVEKAVRL